MRPEQFGNRRIQETDVVGVDDDAVFGVNRTRCTDADPPDIAVLEPGFCREFAGQRRHIGDNFSNRTFCMRRDALFRDDFAVFIDKTRCDIRTAEVDSDVHN